MFEAKKFFTASLATALLLSSAVVASAEISPPDEATISIQQEFPLQLDDMTTITTPYDPVLYDFIKSEEPNEVTVKVAEKTSGRIVSTYGEKIQTQDNPGKMAIMATGTYTTRTVYRTYTDREVNGKHFAGADLYTVYNCYQSGSFGQINSVSSTYWSPMGGGGNFYLEAPNAQSQPTGKVNTFPTNQVTTTGTVVLTTKETSAFGISISKFAFNLGTDGYSRLPIRDAAYNINFGE
ncbi:hypothetical protein [Paenibacillus sp. B2(2019)]|uniref:hypothetical protein n=1 Tax=Paenibacillus sp. B2(2019) TaxID=2607754 RepID=UPI0011F2F6DB|nr:hypothetical protein [Paenibacillus sp. B2(2019)]KAA1180929.1 hypothetical protein PAENI_27235 [Paenibacillus sp. B2(2019)]